MAIENLITDHLDLWTAAVRPKSSAGRGSNSKLELTGIKKLRELILELAVRGKLVPQDPSDEPASVLLERIAAEKTRLVKEGKIKKPKALPEIGEEEKPFELPDGWVWSMLAEIAEINPRNESDDTVDASFVPMSLISTAYNGQHEFEARKWGEIKKGFTHFSNGDIGIAKITPCFENSKAAVFRGLTNGIGAGTTELHIARPYTDYVSAFFILLNIKSPIYLKKGEAGMTGTAGQKRLAKDFFSFYPLPIPPFAEQHRIVAKVDELMALCDQLEQCSESQLAAHQTLVETLLATLTDSCDADELAQNWARLSTHFDTLFTTEASIDALKQTILQLAVMGKLVPQDPSDEPASALLERIAAEKALLVKEKKIKKEKPLPMIRAEEQLFELPIGWEWVRFSQVAHSRLGKMLDNAKNIGNELPYLRNTNVQWDLIELDDIKQMKIDDNEKDELALRYGDLLICEGGEPGRCAIWKHHNKEMYFQKALHRARPYQGVMAEYLQICLTNDAATGTLEQYFTGATIKHFVGAKLNEYSIPLPPTAVQKLIVAKVDELTTLCDQLKSRLQTSQQTQLALAESLVEGALA
ncbi:MULTISPECIES: restriction endonuclease subunit S [Aeromonas]|uniref:restriction endonuclease subunit S n=1 Tax=Aeromonas TaxID=642 RepID=UPI000CD3121C|nr:MULTISPECIES: restriction endonuclease subunit S [Aeromonas]AUV14572.1 restriction endonuclease [Aeromonas sp. ASNIH3]MBF8451698.1 restriction endonuclease subunit S [Aeromonas dhakensis]MBL0506884.1 restriction endonuclease subunit S [Aeromonas veronii]MBL0608259.1 restriction endonuclease subunit S [Aeromonas caviae]MBS4713678.1 restriction endonuclease subunit S [Aeromonas caviae]